MRKLVTSIAIIAAAGIGTAHAKQIMNGPSPSNSCQGYEVQTAGNGSWYVLPYSVANNTQNGPFQLNALITSQVAYTNGLPSVVINFDVTGTACGLPTIANVRYGS